MAYQQRDIEEDLITILDFCQEKGFYYQQCGERVHPKKLACLNQNSKYYIRRSHTDRDELTYYFMEREKEEEFQDDFKQIFNISLDFYDLQTNLIDELNKNCIRSKIY